MLMQKIERIERISIPFVSDGMNFAYSKKS